MDGEQKEKELQGKMENDSYESLLKSKGLLRREKEDRESRER